MISNSPLSDGFKPLANLINWKVTPDNITHKNNKHFSVIGIKVKTDLWLSKNYGLVKYIRTEKSDSVTMGEILYEKTLILE